MSFYSDDTEICHDNEIPKYFNDDSIEGYLSSRLNSSFIFNIYLTLSLGFDESIIGDCQTEKTIKDFDSMFKRNKKLKIA